MKAQDLLSQFGYNIGHYEVSEVFSSSGESLGYQSSIINDEGYSTSGGFGSTLNEANKIACAEFIERQTVKRFSVNPKQRQEWLLDELPTACGFAVGFNRENVILRSNLEAAERFVMSEWIDNQRPIPRIHPNLTQVGRHFEDQFDFVRYYLAQVPVIADSSIYRIFVGLTVGIHGKGLFLGSNASLSSNTLWDHALLESYRHVLIADNAPKLKRFPLDRVHFYAHNKDCGLAKIPSGKPRPFSMIDARFFKVIKLDVPYPVYIARTVIGHWTSWHVGGIDRFLY